MQSVARKPSHPFAVPDAAQPPALPRHITPEAGRALEKLGHAIEYLTDQMVHRRDVLAVDSPELEAIQILMCLNRRVYEDCPQCISLAERFRNFLHRVAHPSLRVHPRR